MAYPGYPDDTYDYTTFQSGSPTTPLPANQVEAGFDEHKTSIDATIDFLKASFNSSGVLKASKLPTPYDVTAAAEAAAAAAAAASVSAGVASSNATAAAASATAAASAKTAAEAAAITAQIYGAQGLLTPEMFVPTAGTGSDDAAALNAWWAAIKSNSYKGGALLAKQYNVYSALTWDSSVARTVCGNGATIRKNFNGTLLTIDGYVGARDLFFDSNAYTGRGVYVISGSDQAFTHCGGYLFAGACLEYLAGAGHRSVVNGGFWQRATYTDPAIVWPDDAAGGYSSGRTVMNATGAGGVLLDLGGADNGSFINCDSRGFTQGFTTSRKLRIIGNRFASVASTLYGTQHVFDDNVMADDITLGAPASNCVIGGGNVFATGKGVIDSSGNATNVIQTRDATFNPPYTVSTLPTASVHLGKTIFVSNEAGGAVLAFSDGTNWRRVTDRAVVS